MPIYHSLASSNFSENWNSGSLTGTTWSASSSIVGFLGDYTTSSPTGVDPKTLTASTTSGTQSLVSDATSTNPSGGAVYEVTPAGGDTTIALNGSGTADAPNIVLYLDSTGRQDVTISFNIEDLDTSADNAAQQVAVQYRTDGGTWINVPGGYWADVTVQSAGQTTTVSNLALPAGAANSATLEVRILTTNAIGNDELIGIDDIVVSSAPIGPSPGTLSVDDVTVAEGNAGLIDITFTVTRSGGSSGTVTVDYAAAEGSATMAVDFAGGYGTLIFADGETSKTVTFTVAGDTAFEPNETFFLNLTNPTGGVTITDGQGVGTITNDDAPPLPGTFSIGDASLTEGDAGTADMTFTVTRTDGTSGTVTIDYAVVLNGTASAGDLGTPTTGTLTFLDGQTSATLTIPVAGDLLVEGNETFSVVLSNPSNSALLGDATGTGTIVNNDLPPIANVWINEFHYDPSSTPETGEFIEIAGNAGIDLSGYRVVLYNGSNGQPYAPTGGSVNGIPLSGVLADSANGFGFASVLSPGLQNGSPDGIALVDPYGRVVQFLTYEGTITAVGGPAAGMTSTDIGRYEDQATPGTSLQLVGTGSSYVDFTWSHGQVNTSAASNTGQSFLSGTDQGQIRVDNASVVEGDAGTTSLTFTVYRSGGFATEASVDYTLSFGTADAADLPGGTPLTGTVTFAAGQLSATITVPVQGDTTPEYNETIFVTLGDVAGNAVVVDPIAVGTIVNNDPLPLTIMQIQGETHWSEFNGQPVITNGIVTAVTPLGFYMQDAVGDGNVNTSDGIFVFTNGTLAVAVGDAVDVTGQVKEYGSDLPLTEIDVLGTGFGVTITSHDNPLPEAVLVGTGGRTPPTETIDSDGLTVFNPAVDGADFWESLEGMRVTLDRPQVVQNGDPTYNETLVIASHGEGATNVNAEGGITISETDTNPEIVQIDGQLVAGQGYVANHSTGDQLGSIDGILGYSFGHYELIMTEVPETTLDVTPVPDIVAFSGDANYLTIATYNVENLDPSDGKYEALAEDIAVNLKLPDIIAVQEMQDNDGTGRGTDLGADQNAQNLIDAIYALTGVTYAYVEIAPTVANSTGGESNGNIRNGYFYQVDRVSLVEGSLQTISDSSYSNSREPLVATWEFQGQQITTINVHFYARSGSDSLWGANQPPKISGDDRRTDQAEAIAAYVNDHLADQPGLNIAVLGDWNGFYWEDAVGVIEAEGLVNVQAALLPEAERYSYVFDGNSQLIDNILITDGLLSGAAVQGVHINAHFGAANPSDHDPQVVQLLLGDAPSEVVLSNASVDENAPAGTVVGTVSATDTAGDTLTFALVDNGGGRFAINATTGVITTTVAIDHEALSQVDLIVRATDSAGQSTDQAFTVAINDINEAPTAAGDAVSVVEDASTANLWSTLLGNDTDPDAGDALAIQSVSTAGTLGHVIFDAATQSLRYVADHDSFDGLAPGATATDTFTYTVVDGDGLTSTATVTVTITGVADGTVITGTASKDTLFGTAGEDTIDGGRGNDTLYGNGGHDLLLGNLGNDRLEGGDGNDRLVGGAGDDVLVGGSGNDVFVFSGKGDNDVILDFDAFADSIRLEGVELRGSRTLDANRDGIADLRLDLGTGGSVTLYSIDSIDDIQFEGSTPPGEPGPALRSMGWIEAPAETQVAGFADLFRAFDGHADHHAASQPVL